jgi:hypothetical protein
VKYLFIGLSVAFACVSAFIPALSPMVLSIAFLSAHLMTEFLGTDSVSAKLTREIEARFAQHDRFLAEHASNTQKLITEATKEVKDIKEAQSQYNLAAGIQSTRKFF